MIFTVRSHPDILEQLLESVLDLTFEKRIFVLAPEAVLDGLKTRHDLRGRNLGSTPGAVFSFCFFRTRGT